MQQFRQISQEEMLHIPAYEVSTISQLHKSPIVSIVMLTRNHDKYIRQAVESVIRQEINFSIEILIGEDFSTDNTKQECEKLQQEYPQFIRLILANKNVGITSNFLRLICRARGKYIALLEGDDYWIHPQKLTLQVELMEKHSEYSWCGGKTINRTFWVKEKESFNFEDTLKYYIIHTSSVLFRTEILNQYPSFPNIVGWISMVYVYLSQHGDCGFINEYLSYYRRHSGGLYTSKSPIEHLKLAHLFTDIIDQYLEYQFSKYLYSRELWICQMESTLNIDCFCLKQWKQNIDILTFELRRTKLFYLVPFLTLNFIISTFSQPLTFSYLYMRRKLALKSKLTKLKKYVEKVN